MKPLHQFNTNQINRTYQFPNAAVTIQDKQHIGHVGYVVNKVYQKELYGVVKYVVDGDRVAWLESPNHFNTDKARAEVWVRETLQGVANGTLPQPQTTYLFDSLNTVEVSCFELDLTNNQLLVHCMGKAYTYGFTTLEELKTVLQKVDSKDFKPEDVEE